MTTATVTPTKNKQAEKTAKIWVTAKRLETKAKDEMDAAKGDRTQAGNDLYYHHDMRKGDRITIDGNRTYEFVTSANTNTAYAKVVDDLVARHPELVNEAEILKAKHKTTDPVGKKSLKPVTL